MEALQTVMNSILTNSACNEESEGETCVDCGKFIPKLQITVFGKQRFVQPCCECYQEEMRAFERRAAQRAKQIEIEKLFSISNLGERFETSTLETFVVREGSEKCVEVAKKYVAEFPNWKADAPMFWGLPGNGKTHLAAAISNDLNAKGHIVVFQSVPDLLSRIRSTFNKSNKESEEQIMKALLTCDLLVLDDIGSEKLSEWVLETLFKVIDGRYRSSRPILYTSNLEPKELSAQIGIRAYDRLVETSVMIQNKATSFRREIAMERMKKYSS